MSQASDSTKPIQMYVFGNCNVLRLYWNVFSFMFLILGNYGQQFWSSWKNIEVEVVKISDSSIFKNI